MGNGHLQSNRVFTSGKDAGGFLLLLLLLFHVLFFTHTTQLVDGYFNCLPNQSNMARVMLQHRCVMWCCTPVSRLHPELDCVSYVLKIATCDAYVFSPSSHRGGRGAFGGAGRGFGAGGASSSRMGGTTPGRAMCNRPHGGALQVMCG